MVEVGVQALHKRCVISSPPVSGAVVRVGDKLVDSPRGVGVGRLSPDHHETSLYRSGQSRPSVTPPMTRAP